MYSSQSVTSPAGQMYEGSMTGEVVSSLKACVTCKNKQTNKQKQKSMKTDFWERIGMMMLE